MINIMKKKSKWIYEKFIGDPHVYCTCTKCHTKFEIGSVEDGMGIHRYQSCPICKMEFDNYNKNENVYWNLIYNR